MFLKVQKAVKRAHNELMSNCSQKQVVKCQLEEPWEKVDLFLRFVVTWSDRYLDFRKANFKEFG